MKLKGEMDMNKYLTINDDIEAALKARAMFEANKKKLQEEGIDVIKLEDEMFDGIEYGKIEIKK